jgi:hypothetical protein
MHGFGLQAQPKPTDAEIGTFVTRSGAMVRRIDRLRDWGHAVVRTNLATIGRSDATSLVLAEYLEAVSDVNCNDRFDAMARR